MISCESFRLRFNAATEDRDVIAHLRDCDRCLDFAVADGPDAMFRSLGGEMIPPGGVDAFVEDVMQQVRVRGAESAARPQRSLGWSRRLAIAATLAAGFTGALLFYRTDTQPTLHPTMIQAARQIAPVTTAKLARKPVIENYESDNATIVEVPTDQDDDMKIVMIFDENLPADL